MGEKKGGFNKLQAGKFTESDKKQVVDFLNFLATEAKFRPNSDGVDFAFSIQMSKHLTFMQQVLLRKIDENILEFVKYVENQEDKNIEDKGE